MSYQIKHIADGTVQDCTEQPVWNAGIWECGNIRITDTAGDQYIPVVPVVYPIVSPVEMKMLYTSPERIAIRANLASASPDATLHDFFELLSDPQLKQVNMNLTSVQGAIYKSLEVIGPGLNPAYTEDDIKRRYAQMLTGQLQ